MSECDTVTNVRIGQGTEVKALGQGIYGGFGVPFGGAPDCTNDVFDTAMGLEELGCDDGRQTIPMLFQHGADSEVGKKRIAKAVFELKPEGLWIEWKFANLSDPHVSNIRDLCDEGLMALSSGSVPHMVVREPRADYYLIKQWPVAEISLTGSACCLSGATRVATLKDFDGLTLAEMNRRRGMSELALAREHNEELRYRVKKILGEPLTECEEKWLRKQREKRVKTADGVKRQYDVSVTIDYARERLKQANELYEQTEMLRKEVETERARLHLGPGVPFRHFEDWLAAGEKSGFVNPSVWRSIR